MPESNVEALPIILGTVQFGLNYGVNNTSGKPTSDEVKRIFQQAVSSGVLELDTAYAYGDAEKIIGENSEVLSGVKIGSKLSPTITASQVENEISNSLKNVKREYFDYIMIHNFEHYNSDVWQKLLGLKTSGAIKKLGVSIYSPDQTKFFKDDIDVVQLPFNILDNRWWTFFASKGNIEIHTRSIYLQGLILNDNLLEKRGFGYLSSKLDGLVEKLNRKNRMDLCFAYVRSISDIDKIVIGVDNLEQLEQNISYFKNSKLTLQEIDEIKSKFQNITDEITDIRKWK